jgi:F0F1-type ATP synthase membrane subunit b/b'
MNYDLIAFWSQIAAFFAFAIGIVWVWKKFMEPAVIAAKDASNRSIAEAERHKEEAIAALDMLREEINGAEQDGKSIRQRAADQARREHDAAIAEAKEAGERQIRNAEGELDRARVASSERLREEILDRALATARTQAASRVDNAVNAKLVDRFIVGLEHKN